MKHKRVAWFLVLLVVLSMGLVACGGDDGGSSSDGGSASTGSPEDTVRSFFDALANLDGDAMAGLMCEEVQGQAEEMVQAFDTARETSEAANLEFSIDVSGVTYEVVSNDGSQAIVNATGEMTMTAAGVAQTFPLSDMFGEGEGFPVVNEGGAWKFCAQ